MAIDRFATKQELFTTSEETMKRSMLLFITVSLLFTGSGASAQSEADKQKLVQAISRLQGSEVSISGTVEEELPAADEQSGQLGGVQRIVMTSFNGMSGAQFKGDFELWTKPEKIAVVSKSEFPGLKFYIAGEKQIFIQAHADEPFAVKGFSNTLKQLVDWKALGEAVEKSSKVRVTKSDNGSIVRVVLDGEYVATESIEKAMSKRIAGGGGANVAIQIGGSSSMTPQVVDFVATFTLSENAEIKGLTFALQYNDPMKAVMAGALRGGAGGAIRIGGNAPKPKQGDEIDLGKLVTYSFNLNPKASDRLSQFVKEVQPLLENTK